MGHRSALRVGLLACFVAVAGGANGAEQPNVYADVVDRAPFDETMRKMSAQKASVAAAHRKLLEERYDLSDKPSSTVKMSRGKPVQTGARVKLPSGVTWQSLGALSAAEIKRRDAYPAGFLPLPHPNHPEGGMLFPKSHIDLVKAQEGRDLARFDLDFLTPEHLLAQSPAAIFLTTRPDLGDVSKGQLVTLTNYYELFSGLLNPKQLEGLRLLLTPFPQQQFNATGDRRSVKPSQGVACLDCHANGNTNGATHLVGDIRPQEFRHRIETPSLRGVNIQRLFGSQRALKSVEDFTEFEQRAAYFDGDPVIATKKGVNVLERGSQVHFMAEFQDILDFPPAPALDVFGKLDPAKATQAQLRGEAVFNGKGRCATCHVPPYYTDNEMHDLQTGRFFEPKMIEHHMAVTDGKIKTFPLRGIKDTPPYLHDGRLLTLEDTVEFFNVVLGTKLTNAEKQDLVAFMQAL
ncbi:MAG: cytochrome B6 [Steroidobacteraceae bacterium]